MLFYIAAIAQTANSRYTKLQLSSLSTSLQAKKGFEADLGEGNGLRVSLGDITTLLFAGRIVVIGGGGSVIIGNT